jgi:hypothetical protein
MVDIKEKIAQELADIFSPQVTPPAEDGGVTREKTVVNRKARSPQKANASFIYLYSVVENNVRNYYLKLGGLDKLIATYPTTGYTFSQINVYNHGSGKYLVEFAYQKTGDSKYYYRQIKDKLDNTISSDYGFTLYTNGVIRQFLGAVVNRESSLCDGPKDPDYSTYYRVYNSKMIFNEVDYPLQGIENYRQDITYTRGARTEQSGILEGGYYYTYDGTYNTSLNYSYPFYVSFPNNLVEGDGNYSYHQTGTELEINRTYNVAPEPFGSAYNVTHTGNYIMDFHLTPIYSPKGDKSIGLYTKVTEREGWGTG